MLRFTYPGHGPNHRAFSGAMTPSVQRVSALAATTTRGAQDGPLFGERGYHTRKAAFQLSWAALTHDEARSLVDQWEDAGGGVAAMSYTPDDQTQPMAVVSTAAPQVTYLSPLVASVTLRIEEQR